MYTIQQSKKVRVKTCVGEDTAHKAKEEQEQEEQESLLIPYV